MLFSLPFLSLSLSILCNVCCYSQHKKSRPATRSLAVPQSASSRNIDFHRALSIFRGLLSTCLRRLDYRWFLFLCFCYAFSSIVISLWLSKKGKGKPPSVLIDHSTWNVSHRSTQRWKFNTILGDVLTYTSEAISTSCPNISAINEVPWARYELLKIIKEDYWMIWRGGIFPSSFYCSNIR